MSHLLPGRLAGLTQVSSTQRLVLVQYVNNASALLTWLSCMWNVEITEILFLLQFVVTAREYHLLAYVVDDDAVLIHPGFRVFFAVRVYALCERNIWLFAIVFTLNMVPFGTNMVSEFNSMCATTDTQPKIISAKAQLVAGGATFMKKTTQVDNVCIPPDYFPAAVNLR